MKPRVAIFGAGGHAKVVADIVRTNAEVDRFVVRETEDEFWSSGVKHGVVAVGDNALRRSIVERILARHSDFTFVTAVHPSAVVGTGVVIGEGTVVMPNVVLNAEAAIGRHVILNTSSSIDHDCRIDDFASIAPGATLGGSCRVGKGTAIGLGAKLIDGVAIGENTMIGAGSVVVKDVEAGVVAYGCPCRFVRKNTV